MSEFDNYLVSKKIDPRSFQKGNELQYKEFSVLFNQVSPASFTQQKLFLINGIRRQYPLPENEVQEEKLAKASAAKPKISTKIKAAKPAGPNTQKP